MKWGHQCNFTRWSHRTHNKCGKPRTKLRLSNYKIIVICTTLAKLLSGQYVSIKRANQASRAVYSLQGNHLQQHKCPLCKLCLSCHRGMAVGIFMALPLQLNLVSSNNLVELLPVPDEQESGHGSDIPL